VKTSIIFLVVVMLVGPGSILIIGGADEVDRSNDQGLAATIPNMRVDEPVTFTNIAHDANFAGVGGNFFAWGDYNNDGYEDLLINGRNLWRNNGPPGWNFTLVTNAVGLLGGTGNGAWADWNNDGYLDLYCTGATVDRLYLNEGPPFYNLTDVTVQAGNVKDDHQSGACGWGDFDKDGDLDLFTVGSENWNNGNPIYYPDYLWRNNGDGTFTDITSSAGITDSPARYGRGVAWGDYDYDGWLDVYISNYRIVKNYLWHNNRDGTFTNLADETDTAGVEHNHQGVGPYYGHTIGSAWADYNNDGQLDLFTANLAHKDDQGNTPRGYYCDDSRLYLNQGPGKWGFDEMRDESGIPIIPIGTVQSGYYKDELHAGAAWADYDNDGDLDLWIPQVYDLEHGNSFLYQNDGDGTFTDVTDSIGVKVWNTYGGAWCDYDNDGDLDLITGGKSPWTGIGSGTHEVHLFQNGGNSNHWLHVEVVGTDSNTNGIGARVILRYGDSIQVREVEAATSSHSQMNSLNVEFGLGGTITTIDEVEVIFSNGRVQLHRDVAVDQVLTVTEDSSSPSITTLTISQLEYDEGEDVPFTYSADQGGLPILSYDWDFDGDGFYDISTSTSSPASHSYDENGLFFPRLRVTDSAGNGFTDTATLQIINAAPIADAGGDRVVYEESVAIFNASGTIDSPGDLASMLTYWDMGDGTVYGWGPNLTIEHNYSFELGFDVELKVRDNDGEEDSDLIRVLVINRPPVGTIDMAPNTIAEDEVASFSCLGSDTPGDVADLRFKWDFGDGTNTQWVIENFTSHIYTNSGTFEVVLKVKDDVNTTTTNHSITVYNVPPLINSESLGAKNVWEDSALLFGCSYYDTISDISNLNFLWDFGNEYDSGWLDGPETLYTYNTSGVYIANLTVRDDDHDTDIEQIEITVKNVVPECSIEDDNMEGEEGEEMEFEEGIGTDTVSDEGALLFMWDFGDGHFSDWSDDPDAYHFYNTSGDFVATFYVKDDDGDSNSTTMDVEIENVKPTAKIDTPGSNFNEDETVVLSGAPSQDTENDISTLEYLWDFTDGTSLTGQQVRHTFRSSGAEKVILTVTDDDGDFSRATAQISVLNSPPVAKFKASSDEVVAGKSISFDASESSDTPSDHANLSYSWVFGDGHSGEGLTIQHTFLVPDIYDVALTVTDDDGEASLFSLTLSVIEGDDALRESNEDNRSQMIALFAAAAIIAITLVVIAFLNLRSRARPPEQLYQQQPSDPGGTPPGSPYYHQPEVLPPSDIPPPMASHVQAEPTEGPRSKGLPMEEPDALGAGPTLLLSSPQEAVSDGEGDAPEHDSEDTLQQKENSPSIEENVDAIENEVGGQEDTEEA